ncbi:MAG: glycosyltransferase family 4 protein [bacterium]|nr:glycosyltransferase family 4 protein [bacterium]
MTRVLLLCPERVRPSMAGVGIRFTEMARSLARRFDVTLGIPNDPEEAPANLVASADGVAWADSGVQLVRYDAANLAGLCRASDAIVLHGHVSNLYFAHGEPHGKPRPLVVDLYDPFPVENLNYFPTLGDEPYRHDRATLERQLLEGDLFLCSSEEQRLFYLGMLLATGRLNPETYFDDFGLANLVRIVPFGLPAEKPSAPEPVLRGVVPGIGPEDPVVLFGGIYDWYDPMLLIRALPALLERFCDLRVVFCTNPNPDSTPQGTYAEVLDACRRRGWLDRHAFFVPWVPYPLRAGLYLESTVAAVLHRPRFETELSMRTRVLDHLWAGLPTVATVGGGMSRLLTEHDMGLVVPEDDEAALTEALGGLLSSPATRGRLSGNARRWAASHTWDGVLEPLAEFLEAPRIDPHKSTYPIPAAGDEPARGLARILDRFRRRMR